MKKSMKKSIVNEACTEKEEGLSNNAAVVAWNVYRAAAEKRRQLNMLQDGDGRNEMKSKGKEKKTDIGGFSQPLPLPPPLPSVPPLPPVGLLSAPLLRSG